MISKETEKEILTLHGQGLCTRHIAKRFGLSDEPVERVIREAGLKENEYFKVLSQEEKQEIACRYESGEPVRSIFKSCNQRALDLIIKEFGLKRRRPHKAKRADYEDRILPLLKQGALHKDIAEQLGVSVGLVYSVAASHGIRYERRRNKISEETEQKITELFRQGYGRRKIAMALEISRGAVRRVMRENPDKCVPDGEKVFYWPSTEEGKVSLQKLAERDNNFCWLCGEVVDWGDWFINDEGWKICGDRYPSIDHVVPLSKGGPDAWDNVRLAHRRCNTLKSNKMTPPGSVDAF